MAIDVKKLQQEAAKALEVAEKKATVVTVELDDLDTLFDSKSQPFTGSAKFARMAKSGAYVYRFAANGTKGKFFYSNDDLGEKVSFESKEFRVSTTDKGTVFLWWS